MKIAYWDLETTDLNGEFGRLLCGSILSYPEGTMTTFRQDDYVEKKRAKSMSDDKKLAIDIRDFIETHQMSAGWFTKGFDVAFLNTRLVAHGQRPLKTHLHIDGIWYVRGWRGLKPLSSKLKDVARYFGLKESKLVVDPQTWVDARGGDRDAMNIVATRCESDVRLTEQVIRKIIDAGLVRNIQSYS